MKWIYRFFTLGILAAALIGPFFINKPDGEPIMSFPTTDNLNPAKFLSSDKPATSGSSFSPSSTTIYKWQDAQGQWHYGDAPPDNNPSVSTLQVDTNTNIIQSLKIEPDEPEQLEGVPAPAKQTLPERLTDGELSFDNALNAINDAKMVRDMMESRNDQLKALSGEK
jgi:hypothetical protein